jgi:transcription elongation factor Elf1
MTWEDGIEEYKKMSIPRPRRKLAKAPLKKRPAIKPYECPVCGKIDCSHLSSCIRCIHAVNNKGLFDRGDADDCLVQLGQGCKCTRLDIHNYYMDIVDNLRMDLEMVRDESSIIVRDEMAQTMIDYYSR